VIVEVLVVLPGHEGLVAVDSPAGGFEVIWSGTLPAVGDVVDVELDVREPCHWTSVANGDAGALARPGWVHGIAEKVESDGVLVLRSGRAITMIEMLGRPPDGVIGSAVAVPAEQFRAFPTHA
jgi:hypothetical protein